MTGYRLEVGGCRAENVPLSDSGRPQPAREEGGGGDVMLLIYGTVDSR